MQRRLLILCAIATVPLASAIAPSLDGWVLPVGILVAVLVGGAGEALARTHPEYPPRNARGTGYWIAPCVVGLSVTLAAARLTMLPQWLIGFGGVLLLGLMLWLQEREIASGGGEHWPTVFGAVGLYAAAFLSFGALTSWGESFLLAAVGCGFVAGLAGLGILRTTPATSARIRVSTAVLVVCTGEVALTVLTWSLTPLIGGAFVLLAFYVASGVLHANLDGTLGRALLLEYAAVGLIGLALLLWSRTFSV